VWKESCPMLFSVPDQPEETGWGKLSAVRQEGNAITVQCISLDEWHEGQGFPNVRVMKIDAEGSEPFILEGAKQMIAHTRPIMIIELNDLLLREVGRPKETVIGSLRETNYGIFQVDPAGLEEVQNTNGVLSPEVLCVPVEKIDEIGSVLEEIGHKR
jgi:hypothetical protein